MKHHASISGENARLSSASLYDRLERAIIALEYALADARKPKEPFPDEMGSAHARTQEAVLSAGEEIQEVLVALKTVALGAAAARVRNSG